MNHSFARISRSFPAPSTNRTSALRPAILIAATAALAFGVCAGSARAEDFVITVSGPYETFTNDGFAFDGTNTTPLAPSTTSLASPAARFRPSIASARSLLHRALSPSTTLPLHRE